MLTSKPLTSMFYLFICLFSFTDIAHLYESLSVSIIDIFGLYFTAKSWTLPTDFIDFFALLRFIKVFHLHITGLKVNRPWLKSHNNLNSDFTGLWVTENIVTITRRTVLMTSLVQVCLC